MRYIFYPLNFIVGYIYLLIKYREKDKRKAYLLHECNNKYANAGANLLMGSLIFIIIFIIVAFAVGLLITTLLTGINVYKDN
jgi:hypothetical protein